MALPQQSLQRNLVQIGDADRLIGRLMGRLRAQGMWKRSLVVVTADHGISFRPGASRRTAAGPGAVDVLGMPLFVKLPGQAAGKVDDRHATTADVLPTIADALGIDLRWKVDGRSLLGAPRPRSDPVVVSVFPDRHHVSMPFDDYVRGRDAQVGAMRFAEGTRGGWAGVYARGAHSDLFGRPVDALRRGTASGLRARLDHPDAFDSVNTHGSTVPAFVSGTLQGSPAGRVDVAFAVNGVVEGVAASYRSGDQTRFGGLVPPDSFRTGANDLRLYEVDRNSKDERLTEIGRAP
jgi:hypothetical protein